MKKTNLLVKALLVTLCFAMVLQLAACGGKGDKDGDKPAGPQRVEEAIFEDREVKNPNIDVLLFWPPFDDIKEINALYYKKYGGKVNVIEKGWDAKTSTISSYVAAGTPCEVVLLSQGDIPTFAAQGLLDEIPMDKLDANSKHYNFDLMKTDFTYKDKVYAVNYNDSTGARFDVLLYNAKLFKQYGVKTPYEHFKAGNWNFDQFRKTAAEMTMDTDDDGFVDLFGYDASLIVFGNLFKANAAMPVKYVDNKYSLNLDDPRILEAYQLYSDMYNVDKSINQSEFKQYQNFLNERCSMVSISMDLYARLYLDGMEKGSAEICLFPSGPAAGGKYFASTAGHTSVGSVKGSNNLDATLAWTDCAISVWLELGKNSPRETLDYLYSDAEKERIAELNAAVVPYSETGLKFNAEGVYGVNFPTANWLTAQSIMTEIRKNVSVSTALEKYKPTLQGQLDNVNTILAGGTVAAQ